MKRTGLIVVAVLLVVAAIVASQAFFIVREGEQVLVIRLSSHAGVTTDRVIEDPGLYVLIPIVRKVVRYDSGVLSHDPSPELVILSDQQRIVVNATLHYEIDDPMRFFKTVRTAQLFNSRSGRILRAVVRDVLGKLTLEELRASIDEETPQRVKDQIASQLASFGATVVDVRLELPEPQ